MADDVDSPHPAPSPESDACYDLASNNTNQTPRKTNRFRSHVFSVAATVSVLLPRIAEIGNVNPAELGYRNTAIKQSKT